MASQEGLSSKELQPEPSADPQVLAIAQQFLLQYYQIFDTNRPSLGALYRNESKLTFEGQTYTGPQKIVQKFLSLTFQSVVHDVTTFDVQLTIDGGVLVFVVGQLKTDDNPAMGFSQTFYLKQIGDSLFVMNDIFRLSLHHTA